MGETRLMSWEAKVIGGLGAVCISLAILWLTNMWNAIEAERKARADLANAITASYATKETIALIANAREKQIEAIVSRIDNLGEQIAHLDERGDRILEELAKIRSEIANHLTNSSQHIGGGK